MAHQYESKKDGKFTDQTGLNGLEIHEFAPAYYLLASGICLHGDVINLSLGLLSLHWSTNN